MSARWNGLPLNPERDGLHYITDAVAFWLAGPQKWALLNRTRRERPEWLAAQPWATYRGPCPDINEVERLHNALRRIAHSADYDTIISPDGDRHQQAVEIALEALTEGGR